MSTNTKKEKKSRHWAFIVYDDSVVDNWEQLLTESGVQCAYIKHDKDINESTGEQKKAHTHVVASFSGPTTMNVVKDLTDSLKATSPQKISSVIGAVRYLIHMDNPEKYQYNRSDIKTINGFDVEEYLEMSLTQERTAFKNVFEIIKINGFCNYSELLEYLLENELDNEFYVCVEKNTLATSKLLDAMYQRGYRPKRMVYTKKEDDKESKAHNEKEEPIESNINEEE